MLRLGYTLSHVVHAYGAMCQAITEVAAENDTSIDANEFHALNRCLDVAIAGAVTDYESLKESWNDSSLEGRSGRGLAKEMRSALVRAKAAFQAIQRGTVGSGGSTAQLLESNLGQLEQLIEQLSTAGDAARPS
jgi:hypothetical protein